MRKELEQAYNLLSPYSDKSRWEFENHLAHLKNFRKIYKNFFRLLACILPGTGEANVILGKIQK